MSTPVHAHTAAMKICAALSAAKATDSVPRREMHERYLRETAGLDEALTGPALAYLQELGYITIFSEYASDPNRRNNWITLTSAGQEAYEEGVEKLKDIATH